jgi:predicted SAM-dependent methyltransferase
MDISRGLPFQNGSFDGVFCEHVLEHFSLDDGERIMREVVRILRPGGCARIVVPDAELIMQQYFSAPSEIISRRGNGDCNDTPMVIINSYFHQRYEHQFLYDWMTLEAMLRRAGFHEIMRTSFGSAARCSAIVLDAPKYEWESLYVEALCN